jgi:hypothetical protein
MTTIVEPPQAIPAAIPAPTPHVATNLEQLEEGVAPKIRFQKAKRQENIRELQDSPLFEA